jgi:hypothetical protein
MSSISFGSLHTKKYFVAIRMLAYGAVSYLVDDYLRKKETACLDSMYNLQSRDCDI